MAVNYVNLILDLYDGAGAAVVTGSVTCTPSIPLTDSTDHVVLTRAPVTVKLFGNPVPVVQLAATDNSGFGSSPWGWLIQPLFPGAPPGRVYLLPFSGGPVQYLSALTPA